jgi:uncharacterized protein (TIGR02145 family)
LYVAASGITYSTARFGAAGIWMTENLRELPKGSNISSGNVPSGGSDYTTQRYNIPNGGYNSSNADTIAKYGYVYNWSAVMNASMAVSGDYIGNSGVTYPVQGICPDGWHVPSDWEWTQLENVLGQESNYVHYTGDACGTPSTFLNGSEYGYYPTNGSPTLDMKMRAPVKTWTGTYIAGVSKTKDEGGFAALPAGFWDRNSSGSFGSHAYFWSSSSDGITDAWWRFLRADAAGLCRTTTSKGSTQVSVRCKRN